jgi:DNA-directed RNA polymerase sigma subunit (sigma70/sigma32)
VVHPPGHPERHHRNAGTIHLPEHVRQHMAVLQRAITDLHHRYAREPGNGEVGRELGLDDRQVAEVLSLPWRLGSLEKPMGAEERRDWPT